MTRYTRTVTTLALCYLGVALLNIGAGRTHPVITILGLIALSIVLALVLSARPAWLRWPRLTRHSLPTPFD